MLYNVLKNKQLYSLDTYSFMLSRMKIFYQLVFVYLNSIICIVGIDHYTLKMTDTDEYPRII